MPNPTYRDCRSLEELWAATYALNKREFQGHELMPIMGNGKTLRPNLMFVFINPTYRNASSASSWAGPRFPFIGTKQVWGVFHRAGLLSDELAYRIKHGTDWNLEFTRDVLRELQDRSLYLTNIVKWTGADAALPSRRMVDLFLPILEREIEIVQPRVIVACGLLPFSHLTRQKIKLDAFFVRAIEANRVESFECVIGAGAKVVPCYFPVGRGNPARAAQLLNIISTQFSR